MNYMVVHEELKRGGLRTIIPDMPHISATGVKVETRMRSAERNIRKHLASQLKAGIELPKDAQKAVRLKQTVNVALFTSCKAVQTAHSNSEERTK